MLETTVAGGAAIRGKIKGGGESLLTTRQPVEERSGGRDEATEEIKVAAELRAVVDLRCGGACKSEEEGVGARERTKGQHRGSGSVFIGRGEGRRGDSLSNGHRWPWWAGGLDCHQGGEGLIRGNRRE
jgi:hypothetical protein